MAEDNGDRMLGLVIMCGFAWLWGIACCLIALKIWG